MLKGQEKLKGIINAKENKEYFFDPTFILKEDLLDHKGQLIHKAGTKVNPLEQVPLSSDLIFINGDNLKQVEFALSHYEAKASKAKIILVKGAPMKLQKEHKIWIYFDQNGILTSKFGISQVPAVVRQDKLRLKISEVVL
jgi:conjugal transfer pilus assembly protein TraW